jgi:tRNA threonylcarbamoyladenosine biosynthesis protein TsaE
MNGPLRLASRSADATRSVGEALARLLAAGDVVFLVGGLGAGKTVLTQGIAAGLGIDPAEVVSPTFVLIGEHVGRRVLHHVDLYRLDDPRDLDEIGLAEILGGEGIAVVEWADRFPGELGEPTVTVRLEPGASETERAVEIEWNPPAPEGWRERLEEALR